jgi:sec-independent protein translocase protein TatA
MGNIGLPELIVILIIILVIFGAGKLPQIGEALGKSIRNFKKAASGEDENKEDTKPSTTNNIEEKK